MKWTKEQEQVIVTRNNNILVSAAAGSGKTAVLSNRVIDRIKDKENPASIDRMLIVTFTKAAASEMRGRIQRELEKALEEDKDNEYLQKQLTYIQSAQISTIHSFCNNLIKDNFETLEIDPAFRSILDDEEKLVKDNILDQVFEEFYEQDEDSFTGMVNSFGGKKSEEVLREAVRKIYSIAWSNPFPEKWLKDAEDIYKIPIEHIGELKWIREFERMALDRVKQAAYKANRAFELVEGAEGLESYEKNIKIDIEALENAVNGFESIGIEAIRSIVLASRIGTLKKGSLYDEAAAAGAKRLRDNYTKLVKDAKAMLYEDYEQIKKELDSIRPYVSTIIEMVRSFEKKYRSYKRQNNMVDFNDMEHLALKILIEQNQKGELVPTKTALQLRESFDEIMVDEYQDSNDVQEYIVGAIAGEDNLFTVGDIKQSIYGFRMAKPSLFINRYDKYKNNLSGNDSLIILDKNFRSRREVINSVNFVFSQIMCKELGGIDYNEDHSLKYGSSYNDINDNGKQNTELIFIVDKTNSPKKEDKIKIENRIEAFFKGDTGSKLKGDDKIKVEGLIIANRIKKLMEEGFKVSTKEMEPRELTYGDIAIVVRNNKKYGKILADVLMAEGIPVSATKNEGFYDTYEISAILNMLRIIDNPKQDIPLAAVLRNIWNFTSQELAISCRYKTKDRYMYDSIVEFAYTDLQCNDEEGPVRDKVKAFLQVFDELREQSVFLSICKLIDLIIEKTGIDYYFGAMEGGDVRGMNIDLLLSKAEEYENTSFSGLFNFIRYMDTIKEREIDMGEVSDVADNTNCVHIMTIHKSKGLEYPIVILAGASNSFSNADEKGDIIVNSDWGIGVSELLEGKRLKKEGYYKKYLKLKNEENSFAEELRVLYVALTRAREKLMIVGFEDVEKLIESIENYSSYGREKFPNTDILDNDSYLKLMTMCIARNGAILNELSERVDSEFSKIYPKVCSINDYKADISVCPVYIDEVLVERIQQNISADAYMINMDKEQVEINIKSRKALLEDSYNPCQLFDKEYEHIKDTVLTTKYSVSEIKKLLYEDSYDEEDEQQQQLYDHIHKEQSYIPQFIEKTEKLTGAGRGTAYHRVFELIDYSKAIEGTEDIRLQIEDMLEKGYIDKLMYEAVEPQKIYNFVASDIGMRMKKASQAGKLYREQQYVMSEPAGRLDPEYKGQETILVQGAIDAFFIEEDQVVVVDYKTDNVKAIEELSTMYKGQLEYYSKAVETIIGMKVKEKIIYSVKYDKQLEV